MLAQAAPRPPQILYSSIKTRITPDRLDSPESVDGLRVIIGAGDQRWEGWIATRRDQIDLTDSRTWAAWFGARRADALLATSRSRPQKKSWPVLALRRAQGEDY